MDAYKRTKKELVEEVRVLHSRLEQLGGGKVKHKQTEDALKESEEHAKIFASYQHAISQLREFYTRMAVETIEGMLEGVTIMDLDGTIRQVNSEFERRSGYKREEVVGKKAVELGIISKKANQRIKKEIVPKS